MEEIRRDRPPLPKFLRETQVWPKGNGQGVGVVKERQTSRSTTGRRRSQDGRCVADTEVRRSHGAGPENSLAGRTAVGEGQEVCRLPRECDAATV